MELRSVAYNPGFNPGMQGMQGMQGMSGMQDMQGMPGMEGMQMQGMQAGMMPGASGMYSQGGFMNMDGNMDPCCVPMDVEGPIPCSPCGTPPIPECRPPHHKPHLPTPNPSHEVYVVRKGDTVWKIAQRFGTTMQAIILANNLRNPDLIYPGQVLFIPGANTGEFYG